MAALSQPSGRMRWSIRDVSGAFGQFGINWAACIARTRQAGEGYSRRIAQSVARRSPIWELRLLTTVIRQPYCGSQRKRECERLFARVVAGKVTAEDAEQFRAQVLFEMARMSVDDGLVMQIHPGSFRNHNRWSI